MLRSAWQTCFFFLAGLLSLGMAGAGISMAIAEEPNERPAVIIPAYDAMEGRRLFIAKGCVLCHSVKGVGGNAAPDLQASASGGPIDLLGFVARMWRGAAAMLELQKTGLGYEIALSPQEIADLAAFAGSPAAQEGFSLEDIPEHMHLWLLEAPHWEEQDWPKHFDNPQRLFGDGIF